MRIRVWLGAAAALLASCAHGPSSVANGLVHVSPIDGPRGYIVAVTWPTSDTLVVSYNPDPAENLSQPRLWTLHPDGSNFRALAVKDESSDCYWVAHSALLSMPDGSIAYLRDCSSKAQDPPFVLSIE